MTHTYNKIFDPEKWKQCNQESKNLIEDYKKELISQKKSKGTIDQYYNDLRIVAIYALDRCDNKSLLEMTKRNFRDFVIYCSNDCEMSNARVNRMMSAVRTILNFAEEDDEEYEDYERNAAEKIKGLSKEPVREIQFLSDDLIEQLYNKLMNEERFKEATLLGVLYDSGARRNEIAQIDRKSLQEGKDFSQPVKGKRGKIFRILFFSRTKNAFKKYEETRTDDSDKLFPAANIDDGYSYIYNTVIGWRKDLKELTDKDYEINPHSFRHSFVQNFLDGKHYLCKEKKLGAVPLEKVKTLCHHESSDTTLNYAQDNSERDIEDLFGIKLGD